MSTNNEHFKLSYACPVFVSDIEIRTIFDKAFIKNENFETTQMHFHPYFEVHICTSGEYRMIFENKELTLPVGSVCLIPVQMSHASKKKYAVSEKLALRFAYSRAKKKSCHTELYDSVNSALSNLRDVLIFESKYICKAAVELRDETLYPKTASDVLTEVLLSKLYALLIRHILPKGKHVEKGPGNESFEVRYLNIDNYLSENYSKKITEEDLAIRLSISKRHLSRVFLNTYGKTFNEKLTELRLVRACELLKNTEMSIEEIAYAVGYLSYSGFAVTFKKVYGITASEFRSKYRRSL